jgi:hypothetical protein
MKLTPAQLQHVEKQLQVEAVPEDNPMVPELIDIFGDHTFFVNTDGLHIIEPVEQPEANAGNVVTLATWAPDQESALVPQDPQPTEIIVALAPEDPDPAV